MSRSKDYCIGMPTNDGVTSLAFNPSASSDLLAVGSTDGRLHVFDVYQDGSTQRINDAEYFELGRRISKEELAAQDAGDTEALAAFAAASSSSSSSSSSSGDSPSAVLCAAWSGDGSTVFGGTASGGAYMWPVDDGPGGEGIEFADHGTRPIHAIHVLSCPGEPLHNLILTAGWDRTLRYWDVRQPKAVAVVPLGGRPFALDVAYPLLGVAEEGRHTLIFDLRSPSELVERLPSPLRYETRSLAIFPDQRGVALGSTEGRVAVQHLSGVEKRHRGPDFVFKCHRQRRMVRDEEEATGVRMEEAIYPVNAIAFHPSCFPEPVPLDPQRRLSGGGGGGGGGAAAMGGAAPFATVGGDGVVNLWEKDRQQRLKELDRPEEVGADEQLSCSALSWNSSGSMLAYALCPDWGERELGQPPPEGRSCVMLHNTPKSELRPKG